MTTNSEVMTVALRKINVLAEGQSLSGEQGLTVLPLLNAMMEEWTERDIQIGYFAQSVSTDTCPIPAYAERAVKANLAIVAAPSYGAPIPPEVAFEADESFKILQRKCMVDNLQPVDTSHLPRGSGSLGNFDDITV